MKTIEQRATEYACDDGVMPDSPECESCFNIYGKCTRDAHIAGAMAEHKELTRWHDPEIELPQNGKTVLIRLKSQPYYAVGCYAPNSRHEYEWQTADRIIPNIMVIGWREIHENE